MRGIAVLVLASACYGGIDQSGASDDGAPSDPVVDAAPPVDGHQIDELDRQIVDRASHTGRFSRIDRAPYPSALGAFTIDVLINHDARAYSAIHPDGPGTNVVFDEGTLIIRKVYDATGVVEKITLMAKGPAGYDASIGDWWFGVTDPSGVPLADGNGGYQVGRLTQCHGCHIPHANNDYLFGVPAADQ